MSHSHSDTDSHSAMHRLTETQSDRVRLSLTVTHTLTVTQSRARNKAIPPVRYCQKMSGMATFVISHSDELANLGHPRTKAISRNDSF